MEYWVGFRVHPVVGFGGLVATETISLVICRHITVFVVGLKQRPTPALTPQWVIFETALAVLDHYKPLLQAIC